MKMKQECSTVALSLHEATGLVFSQALHSRLTISGSIMYMYMGVLCCFALFVYLTLLAVVVVLIVG